MDEWAALQLFVIGLASAFVGALAMRLAWRPRCKVCAMVASLRSGPLPHVMIDESRESFSRWPLPLTKKDDRTL